MEVFDTVEVRDKGGYCKEGKIREWRVIRKVEGFKTSPCGHIGLESSGGNSLENGVERSVEEGFLRVSYGNINSE